MNDKLKNSIKKNIKKESPDNQMENYYLHRDTQEFLHKYDNPNFEENQMKTPFRVVV